jgi:hypothetical protein
MTSAVSPEKSMAPVAEDVAFYHGDHVKVIRQHPGREHACDALAPRTTACSPIFAIA